MASPIRSAASSPHRVESMTQLERAIGQCLQNEKAYEYFDMSSVNCITGEQTLRLKTLKNKISVVQLKDLMGQMIGMIRNHGDHVKQMLNIFGEQMCLMRGKINNEFTQKQEITLLLKKQNNTLKQSQNHLKNQINILQDNIIKNQQQNKHQLQQKTKQISDLKQTISSLQKQKQILVQKSQIIKKQSYKTYQQSFQLQQKIHKLTDELQQQKQQYQLQISTQRQQIEKLRSDNQKLNSSINNRQKQIISLRIQSQRNNIKQQIKEKVNTQAKSKFYLNLNSSSSCNQSREKSSQRYNLSSSRPKLSTQTMQFLKSTSNEVSPIENPLQKYTIRQFNTPNSSKQRQSSQRPDSKRKQSRERIDFNRIQYEIQDLKQRLRSDMNNK